MSIIRRWCLLALALCFWSMPVMAGDRALINFIGYSANSRYFAFEEYGELDGVGLAYSRIAIVDLTTGGFAGSPVYKEADEDTQRSLSEIRAEAAVAAKEPLALFKIAIPVEIQALSGDGVIGLASEMRFGLPGYALMPGATDGDYTLSLTAFNLPMSTLCEEKIDRPGLGFALSLSGDGPTRELHRDATSLPEWRGCALGYRLYAIVTPYGGNNGLSAGAAIVSAYPFDFEGPSRRFIVVPTGWPNP